MPKVLMVIALNNFKDVEYFEPKEILQNNDIGVVTVSSQLAVAKGSDGRLANVDLAVDYFLADKARIADYDAVIFIGGGGMAELVKDTQFIQLAQAFDELHKIVAAICVAPVLLAYAGILKNKNATVYADQENIDALVNNGAEYDGGELVVDDNIVTASGPNAVYKFGLELVRLLKK